VISHRKLVQPTEAHLLSANVNPHSLRNMKLQGGALGRFLFFPHVFFFLGNTGDRKPRVSRVAKDSENNTNEVNASIHLPF
jgi:hypothetical protein